ncbi:MAG: hypothetical protein HY553_13115 [Elusimicrobia bacterium]|nr:hypothetical protein [Elusimicrobiota bacterium]
MNGIRARIARAQAFYYLITGLWALFELDSFEWVTGPKTDDWLVKTVAVLVVAIGASLLVGGRRAPGPETAALGMASAAALFGIDCWYVWADEISEIYLLDAFAEGALVIAWLLPSRRRFRVGIVRRAAPHWRSHEKF